MCKKKDYCNREVDSCINQEVKILKDRGFKTISSCCGHKKYPKTIIIRKINNIVFEWFSGRILKNYNPKFDKRHNTYYKKDKEGFYYIPEIIGE